MLKRRMVVKKKRKKTRLEIAQGKFQKGYEEKKLLFNKEINRLFKQLVEAKNERVSNFESTKKKLMDTFDDKINELYKKRDFISEVFFSKRELRRFKVSLWSRIRKNTLLRNLKILLSMPFIYLMFIPTAFFHVCLEIYHNVCFRLYGIPRVKAKQYFIFDRKSLPHLNWLEKFNCMYCSYFNCLISYTQEIGAQTERYWCPIKHSRRLKNTHSEYDKFVNYSDAKNLRKRWNELRKYE